MGGWKLEVAKMALYMTFPVALFHYFNQPEYFEEWVTKMRREMYPPESKYLKEEFKEAIRKNHKKYELNVLDSQEGK